MIGCFTAIECKTAMPVDERLFLVLPEREIFDYLCTGWSVTVDRIRFAFGAIAGVSSAEIPGAARPHPSLVRKKAVRVPKRRALSE